MKVMGKVEFPDIEEGSCLGGRVFAISRNMLVMPGLVPGIHVFD
jgi:hypothetical protein